MQQRSTALRFHTRGKTFEIENIRAISYYTGLLEFRSTDGRIDFQITCDNDKYLADQLESWAAKIRGRTVAAAEPGIIRADSAADPPNIWQRKIDVRTVTPQFVIDYFRQSPVLNPLADDVEKALSGVIEHQAAIEAAAPEAEPPTQLQQDLAVCEPEGDAILSARYPQAEIARLLGVPNAGSYRQRILEVLDVLGGEMEAAA